MKTYYLQPDGKWNENRPVVWTMTGEGSGKLYSGGSYLYTHYANKTYYLYPTNSPTKASVFQKIGDRIRRVVDGKTLYLSMPDRKGNAQLPD